MIFASSLEQIRISDLKILIPDEGLRDYAMTGVEYFSEEAGLGERDYYKIFGNLLNLTFMYAFSCYEDLENRTLDDGDERGVLADFLQGGNANARRVIRTFSEIYKTHAITNELIQFVLLDIYFDFRLGKHSHLSPCLPACFAVDTDDEINLNNYFTLINQSINSSRSYGKSSEELAGMLVELIEMLPFLGKVSLYYDQDRGWYVFKMKKPVAHYPKGNVNTFGLINRIRTGRKTSYHYDFFYLTEANGDELKYERVDKGSYATCYLNGNTAEPATATWVPEKAFGAIVKVEGRYEIPMDEEALYSYLNPLLLKKREHSSQAVMLEQLFNVNYKYIKNLALAIADAFGLRPVCGERMLDVFKAKYPAAVERYDERIKNWDTVVLMLLIEATPLIVLQEIFCLDSEIIETIVENLRDRFALTGRDMFNREFACSLKENARRIVRVRKLNMNTRIYMNMRTKMEAEVMASLILAQMSDVEEKEIAEESFSIGNIQLNIEALQGVLENATTEEKYRMLYAAFGEYLKKICCFYAGIYAYGGIKREYELASSQRMLQTAEIQRYQIESEKAFEAAARAEFDSLKDLKEGSLIEIIKAFVGVCDRCHTVGVGMYESREESRALATVLGKNRVMDVDDFLTLLLKGSVVELTKPKSGKELRTLIDQLGDPDVSHPDGVNWWLAKSIELLYFLRTGKKESTSKGTNVYGSVVPLISSYNRGDQSRGGYQTAMFSLVIDPQGTGALEDMHVSVLSEFTYNMTSKYYCMPHVGRATRRWWIDPLILKCQLLDDIFEKR